MRRSVHRSTTTRRRRHRSSFGPGRTGTLRGCTASRPGTYYRTLRSVSDPWTARRTRPRRATTRWDTGKGASRKSIVRPRRRRLGHTRWRTHRNSRRPSRGRRTPRSTPTGPRRIPPCTGRADTPVRRRTPGHTHRNGAGRSRRRCTRLRRAPSQPRTGTRRRCRMLDVGTVARRSHNARDRSVCRRSDHCRARLVPGMPLADPPPPRRCPCSARRRRRAEPRRIRTRGSPRRSRPRRASPRELHRRRTHSQRSTGRSHGARREPQRWTRHHERTAQVDQDA